MLAVQEARECGACRGADAVVGDGVLLNVEDGHACKVIHRAAVRAKPEQAQQQRPARGESDAGGSGGKRGAARCASYGRL